MSKTPTLHIGRKIERIRMLRGIKQETLAASLGITQAAVSKMEQSEKVSDEKLGEVAKVLGVTSDAIKNFDENASINNNVYDQNNTVINYQFNPVEKIVELYERLLKSEREKNEILQSQLKKQV
jgi:transcriptional regulator with XRE-family HTH domain